MRVEVWERPVPHQRIQPPFFNLMDPREHVMRNFSPMNGAASSQQARGGVTIQFHLVEMPSQSIVYDMVYRFMKHSTHPYLLVGHGLYYSEFTIYRQVENGYVLCQLDEPISDRHPNKISSFVAIGTHIQCDDKLCNPNPLNRIDHLSGFKTHLKEGAIESILGPRPYRSAERSKSASGPKDSRVQRFIDMNRPEKAAETADERREKDEFSLYPKSLKAKREPVKEQLPELPLPEPPMFTAQQRIRARREEAANTALHLNLEAQANDEKVLSTSPTSRSGRPVPKPKSRTHSGGKKKKYTRKV